MNSTRLPGKVLKPLAGKPMIQWILERLQMCRRADCLVLATTCLEQDTPLVHLAERMGVEVFCGSEGDVLDRYYQCAKAYRLQTVVRATGDNPFVDPEEGDRLVDFHLEQRLDYSIISTSAPCGYPLGIGLMVFDFPALERAWREGHAPHHREHVDEYLLENPSRFKQMKMLPPPEKCAPELSMTVDTAEQFEMAETVYRRYLAKHSNGPVPVVWAIKEYQERLLRRAP